jgi:hypothetical protein
MLVRLRDLRHGGASSVETRQWPLATLVAYLFDGRECDDVRALLAEGTGTAHEATLSWPPVKLSPEEIGDIEQTFPQSLPASALNVDEVVLVELHCPALRPVLVVPLRGHHPLVREMAERASYLRFDYGQWADVYVATLSAAEAAELLADPARRASDYGTAELAARVVGEDDFSLNFIVPRANNPQPWS